MFLENLHEFNKALVYGFDTEKSENGYVPNTIQYARHVAHQYQDVYNAYIYAQDVILADIKNNGLKTLTADKLLEWIRALHQHIAATLARDAELVAGEYPKPDEQVVRFHPDAGIGPTLVHTLSYPLVSDEVTRKTAKVLAVNIKVDEKTIFDFLCVAKRFQKPDPVLMMGSRTFFNIVAAVNDNKLSPSELTAISKVMTVKHLPEKIPGLMRAYAEKTVEAWKACDPTNTQSVANLVADAFYGFTSIHPYFNGNGRTATCLLNVMLRSLGYPSILLRNPSERDDPASSYSKAIAQLEAGSCDLLRGHILERITQTKAGLVFKDVALEALVIVRVTVSDMMADLQREFPLFDAHTWYTTTSRDIFNKHAVLQPHRELMTLADVINAKHKELRVNTPEGKAKLKLTMQTISGLSDWKCTVKDDDLKVWRECSEAEKTALVGSFNALAGFSDTQNRVSSSRITGREGRYVVMVSAINADVLSQLQPAAAHHTQAHGLRRT